MSSVDRIELYEYLLNLDTTGKIFQGCIHEIDILKDYAECKTKSNELTSCDLFKYKSYSLNLDDRKGKEMVQIGDESREDMDKQLPGGLKPYTSDVPWDVSYMCINSNLSKDLIERQKWIYENFPNIFQLLENLMSFLYEIEDKNIKIKSENIGQKLIADGQRNERIIELFNVIMKKDSVLTDLHTIIGHNQNIYFKDRKTKYFNDENELIERLNNMDDFNNHIRVETKVFSMSSNLIIVGDLKGNLNSLMRILLRLYLSKVIGQNFKILINNLFIVFTGDWFGEIDSVGGYIVYRILNRLMNENKQQVIVTKIPNKFNNLNTILEKVKEFKIDLGIFSGIEDIDDSGEEDEENIEPSSKNITNSRYINNLYLLNNLLPSTLLVKKDGDSKWIWIGNYLEVGINNIDINIKNAIYIKKEEEESNNESGSESGSDEDDDEYEYVDTINEPHSNNHGNVRYYISFSSNNEDLDPNNIQNSYIIMGQKKNDNINDLNSGNRLMIGGGHNNLRYRINKFKNLRTLQRCSKKICSGHTYEINIPEEKLKKNEYIGLETTTFMRRKDSFICLRMNISPLETSFIHIIPEIISIDENNYLQRMRNGKIYIEKQLLKKYIREIREIIDVRIPRNKILEVLKKNGYNPNRALVELANFRISHKIRRERLPNDKFIMIEPSAVRIKKSNDVPVSYSKFNIPTTSKADLSMNDLSLILFHVKRANTIKSSDIISLRSPEIFKTNDNGIFLGEDFFKENEDEYDGIQKEGIYVHGIYKTEQNEYHGLFKLKNKNEYTFVTGINFLSPYSKILGKNNVKKYTILSMYYFGTEIKVNNVKIRPDDIDTLDLMNINLQIGETKDINFTITEKVDKSIYPN